VPEVFLAWRNGQTSGSALTYRPALLANGRVHFVDAKRGLDRWEEIRLLAPLEVEQSQVSWERAEPLEADQPSLDREPERGARFDALPGAAARARSYAGWANDLKDHLYRTRTLTLQSCPALKLTAGPDESEGEFRIRVQQALRERRSGEIDALRDRYATRLTQLEDQIRRAEERVARERAQYDHQKLQTAVSVGASILGALFGRKAASLGGATTAARGFGRAARERGDVDRVQESVEVLVQRRADLEAELEAKIDEIGQQYAPESLVFDTLQIRPRKSDISVDKVSLAWTPWWLGSDGATRPAYS
jgi:hypothetical protein